MRKYPPILHCDHVPLGACKRRAVTGDRCGRQPEQLPCREAMKRGCDCPVRLRLGEGGHVVADSGVGPCLGPVASLIAAEHYEQGHWLGGVREGYADLGEVRLHYVEAGDGPLVVLLHGFPEFGTPRLSNSTPRMP